MDKKQNLFQRLANEQTLTDSEKKLASVFEAGYPHIAFKNLAEISAQCGLSKATVTRFIRRLGYADFKDFNRQMKEEVSQELASPKRYYAANSPTISASPPAHLLERHFNAAMTEMGQTLAQLDRTEFTRCAALLADEKRPLYLMSTASSAPLIEYFYILLHYLRGNVHLLDGDISTLPHRVTDAGSDAVLVLLAISRHPRSSMHIIRHFRELGAETIFISNRQSGMIARYARHTFYVYTDAGTLFRSRASSLVLIEAFLSAVAAERGELSARYEVIDKLTNELGLFADA